MLFPTKLIESVALYLWKGPINLLPIIIIPGSKLKRCLKQLEVRLRAFIIDAQTSYCKIKRV